MSDDQKTPSEVSFEALRLYSGMVLQIQSLADEVHHSVKYIGAIIGKSILVTLPIVNGKGIRVLPAQVYVIRGFTGKHAFAFEAPVIMARDHPFPYIHFVYPCAVNSRAVRKSLRVKINLSAQVAPKSGENTVPVTMVDISSTGSMVDSSTPIGIVCDAVKLKFSVVFEGISANLDISAIVRSIQKPENGKSLRTGLEFENISYNDNLMLRCFVHTVETAPSEVRS